MDKLEGLTKKIDELNKELLMQGEQLDRLCKALSEWCNSTAGFEGWDGFPSISRKDME